MDYDKVEDTFFEAFQGKYVRALITGPTEKIVKGQHMIQPQPQAQSSEGLKGVWKDSLMNHKHLMEDSEQLCNTG